MPSSAQKFKPSKDDFKVSRKHHWDGKRKGFFIAVGVNFWMLQLLFITVMSLLYGSQFKDEQRIHKLSVLAVDYDNGLVGESVTQAYDALRGGNFPSFNFEPVFAYPDVQSIENAVGSGKYWAAVYTWPNASEKLSAAIEGGEAAASFNPEQMISFVWLEARYPTVAEGYLQPNLNELISASATILKKMNGSEALKSLNQSDLSAVQAYLNPIVASNINLKPVHHGTRVLYNTASVALSIVQMFFFVLAINGISAAMNLFSRLTILTNVIVRQGLAATYTFVAALLEITYIWAFKEDWEVRGYMFVLLWMVTWLHMWVNFMVVDTAACFAPMQYMPYIVVSYILLNITSSIVCIPIAPAFYRYSYAMPSHNWYEAFITITTGGYVNTLYRSLPILFAWFIVGLLVSIPAMTWRCRNIQEAANASQQIDVSGKTADLESGSSASSSDLTEDVQDNKTELEIPIHKQRTNATLPGESTIARQQSNPYFPSIPVGFEGIERILSRD